ncbi:hypothetical protein V8B97DRAFT_348095 [Scleroderma yunnanense]
MKGIKTNSRSQAGIKTCFPHPSYTAVNCSILEHNCTLTIMRFTALSICIILSNFVSSATAAPVATPAPVEVSMQRRSPKGEIWRDAVHEKVQREVPSTEIALGVEKRTPNGEIWKIHAHEAVQEKPRSAELAMHESSISERLLSVVISDELQV